MNTTAPASPDAAPAQALWVQLATCVTTQPLHYRSGEEETAAENIAGLFGKVRDLLGKHPDATAFRALALRLLNDTLRPCTARWHGWLTADKVCRDADGGFARHRLPTLPEADVRVLFIRAPGVIR